MGYVIIFVVANIIGSGVYKKIAPMASELHSSIWILMAWIVGGIITLFGALSNAEVAGLLADTGGEFIYLKKFITVFLPLCTGGHSLRSFRRLPSHPLLMYLHNP
jgi:APA family basic amino acid/polyamine antiporter